MPNWMLVGTGLLVSKKNILVMRVKEFNLKFETDGTSIMQFIAIFQLKPIF